MDDILSQRLEIYNESTILLTSILLMPYASLDFSSEASSHQLGGKFGWVIIVITLLNVIVNQVAMLIGLIGKVKEISIKVKKKIIKCWGKFKKKYNKHKCKLVLITMLI